MAARPAVLSATWRLLRTVLLWLILLLMFLGGGYVYLLDHRLRAHFDGKKWQVPAHVYAQAVQWYPGLAASADDLERVLEILQYRRDGTLQSTATYARKGDSIVLRTRAFKFWDRAEPSRRVQVTVTGGRVSAIANLDQRQRLPLLRLDPLLLGDLYPGLQEDRLLVKLGQVPAPLIQALLVTEDRDFFRHRGVSLPSIARAIWADVRAGGVVQGGSTITQQFVKNFLLNSERTLSRKIKEAMFAILLEARYSKVQILEAYLNEIYLGQDGARAIHGIGLASEWYFRRPLNELHVHEQATLIAMLRGPSYYDPWSAPARVLQRRNLILEKLAEAGILKGNQLQWEKTRPLTVAKEKRSLHGAYTAFLDVVRRQLRREYDEKDLASDGLNIFTTLDIVAQQQTQWAATQTLVQIEQAYRLSGLQVAAVVTRRGSGEIAAVVGSRELAHLGFNRALDAVRQIGSLAKPAVYLTALEYGRLNPASWLEDTPVALKLPHGPTWRPQNYDQKSHGRVAMHTALARSYNQATVRMGMNVGLTNVAKTFRRLGVERQLKVFPALLLGALDLSPMEVAQMYQTFADEGFVTPLRAIQAVVSADGKLLKHYALRVRPGPDPGAVYIVNTLLQEAIRSGTGRSVYSKLKSNFNAAGKTGTTNDLRDSWFAGFSGDYSGVVWVGRDDNRSAKLSGARGALPIWAEVMRRISREPVELTQPANIEWARIDPASGLRVADGCSGANYPFLRGTVPAGQPNCAASAVESQAFDAPARRLP